MEGLFGGLDGRIVIVLGLLVLAVIVGMILVTSFLDSRRRKDRPPEDPEDHV